MFVRVLDNVYALGTKIQVKSADVDRNGLNCYIEQHHNIDKSRDKDKDGDWDRDKDGDRGKDINRDGDNNNDGKNGKHE